MRESVSLVSPCAVIGVAKSNVNLNWGTSFHEGRQLSARVVSVRSELDRVRKQVIARGRLGSTHRYPYMISSTIPRESRTAFTGIASIPVSNAISTEVLGRQQAA